MTSADKQKTLFEVHGRSVPAVVPAHSGVVMRAPASYRRKTTAGSLSVNKAGETPGWTTDALWDLQ